jgi:hypothetical protein
MRLSLSLLCGLTFLACTSQSPAVLIKNDTGGRIGAYVQRFNELRQSAEMVVIDQACLSACTLVLGMVPQHRICVTRRTVFGFHAAWVPDVNGQPVRSEAGTQALWEIYPPNIRQWIAKRGGLQSKMIFLRGQELLSMYQECGNYH